MIQGPEKEQLPYRIEILNDVEKNGSKINQAIIYLPKEGELRPNVLLETRDVIVDYQIFIKDHLTELREKLSELQNLLKTTSDKEEKAVLQNRIQDLQKDISNIQIGARNNYQILKIIFYLKSKDKTRSWQVEKTIIVES